MRRGRRPARRFRRRRRETRGGRRRTAAIRPGFPSGGGISPDCTPSTSSEREARRSRLPNRKSAAAAARKSATIGDPSRERAARGVSARSIVTPATHAPAASRRAHRAASVKRARRPRASAQWARRDHKPDGNSRAGKRRVMMVPPAPPGRTALSPGPRGPSTAGPDRALRRKAGLRSGVGTGRPADSSSSTAPHASESRASNASGVPLSSTRRSIPGVASPSRSLTIQRPVRAVAFQWMSRTGSAGRCSRTPRGKAPTRPDRNGRPDGAATGRSSRRAAGGEGRGYTRTAAGTSSSTDFSNRENGNRVESEAWIESSSPLRAGRNGTTRVTDVPGAMSGKRTVAGSSPARRIATREIPGNRFASAEQVTARNASPPANASEASRTFSVTCRSVPSDRTPDRRIRDRLRLKAR